DPAESEGCCSSWNRKATTRPDSNSETSAAFDLRAEGSVCIGCAFRDRLRPSERPNRNGHWFGSSVLKCEAWDFSLFCRSRSFCYHASGDVSDHGGAMARITIDVDLIPEVEITGYQRYQDGHGLEVRWPLPARCRCEKCGHDDVAHIEFKTIPQAIRDLNLWEQPCFWIYQAPFHRCARCNYRQHI